MRIDTNVDFVSVTWTAGSHEWTDNNTARTSVFSYAYDNMGSTDGNLVAVRAVVKDANGNEDAAEKTITVWKPIRIQSMPFQSSFAVGEEFDLTLTTNIPFHTVRWYDGKELIDEDTSGGTESRVPHRFVSGDGSPKDGGKIHTISATVFLNDPASEEANVPIIWGNIKENDMPRDASSDSWTRDVRVYEDLGLLWWYVDLSLDSIAQTSGDNYTFVTSHTVWYYNDRPGKILTEMRGRASWYEKFDAPGAVWNNFGVTYDRAIPDRIAFKTSFSFPVPHMKTLTDGRYYAVQGYTNLHSGWDNQNDDNGAQIQLPHLDDLDGPRYPIVPSIPSPSYMMHEPTLDDNAVPRSDGVPLPKD